MDNSQNPPAQSQDPPVVGSSTLPTQKTVSSRIKHVLIGIITLGTLGVILYLLIGRQSERLATVVLSNQKEIYIGQTAKDTASVLGHVSLNEDVDLLEYPVPIDLTHPLQATLYLHDQRLVAVRINRDQSNVDKQTGIYVGMTLDEVKSRNNNQTQFFSESVKYGRANGLVKEDGKIKRYYLTNACIANDNKVRVIVIVEKGFEERALELGAGCNGRGN